MGAVLAIVGASVLITNAAIFGNAWRVVSTSIYGTTLVLLYTMSTLYHSLPGPSKKIFRLLDHISIYLLIAGSYTPFCLVSLRGPWGWWLFGINWALAIAGITFELTLAKHTRIPSLVIYVLMGWMVMAAMKPLALALPAAGLTWLTAGGLLYTGGIVFYLFDKKIRHFHGIWHLFVMGGSICQYFCILFYVV